MWCAQVLCLVSDFKPSWHIEPGFFGQAESSSNFSFPNDWPNPGPGTLPLDSGRGDVEVAIVFASLAEFLLWSLVRKNQKVVASKTGTNNCNSETQTCNRNRTMTTDPKRVVPGHN